MRTILLKKICIPIALLFISSCSNKFENTIIKISYPEKITKIEGKHALVLPREKFKLTKKRELDKFEPSDSLFITFSIFTTLSLSSLETNTEGNIVESSKTIFYSTRRYGTFGRIFSWVSKSVFRVMTSGTGYVTIFREICVGKKIVS